MEKDIKPEYKSTQETGVKNAVNGKVISLLVGLGLVTSVGLLLLLSLRADPMPSGINPIGWFIIALFLTVGITPIYIWIYMKRKHSYVEFKNAATCRTHVSIGKFLEIAAVTLFLLRLVLPFTWQIPVIGSIPHALVRWFYFPVSVALILIGGDLRFRLKNKYGTVLITCGLAMILFFYSISVLIYGTWQ